MEINENNNAHINILNVNINNTSNTINFLENHTNSINSSYTNTTYTSPVSSKRCYNACKYFYNFSDSDNHISILSLNTNGINTNYGYINKVVKEYDVIALQETMAIKTQKIKESIKNNSNYKFFNKKAVKTKIRGRGSGGLSFIVNNKHAAKVDYPSDRIGILRMENLAIINVYMPCYKSGDHDQTELYEKEMDCLIKWFLELKKDGFKIIITGDFNIDNFNLENENELLIPFNRMMNQLKVSCVDVEMDQSIQYTFKTAETWLDHVLTDERLFENIDVRIKEDYRSKSDHFPLVIRTSYEKRPINVNKTEPKVSFIPKYIFNSAEFKSTFQANIMSEINQIEKLIEKSKNITNELEHQENVNLMSMKFYDLINRSILKAKESKMNSANFKYLRSNTWWSDHAQILYDEKDSLQMLNSSDKEVLERIKRIKRQIDGIKNNWEKRGIKGHLTKRNITFKHERTNFWRELKQRRRNLAQVDLTTKELKTEFEQLFNTKLIGTSQEDIPRQNEINRILKENENKNHTKIEISVNIIKEIINKLPNNKANGQTGLSNEIIKMMCKTYETNLNIAIPNERMLNLITNIVQYMFDHAVFPEGFNTSVMYALVKDNNKSSSCLKNIRGISVSDLFTNIFEKVMLVKINEVCPNISKQFGFNRNASCSHSVFVLKETMQIVKMRRSKMYATAIDASKAFDKVNRLILWLLLFDKIGFRLTFILIRYYAISCAYVSHKGEQSEIFKTTIGVKQGGPLSPRLFCIYIESLEKLIDDTNIGVRVGSMKINLLLYADDIVLISNSKSEMQTLINVVEKFGKELEIKFNPEKTNYIGVNEHLQVKGSIHKRDIKFIRMYGVIVDSVSSLKYLGTYINESVLNKDHLEDRYKMVAMAVKELVDKSGFHSPNVSVEVKIQLYKSYVRPVLLYGMENLILGNGELDKLQTKEENIIKCALGLSTRLSKESN